MDFLEKLGPLPTAFGLGTLVHITLLKNFELDVWIPHFAGACLISLGALTWYHLVWRSLSVLASIHAVTTEVSSFTIGIFASMTVYRLFFHRIRRFPGPFWAKITRFYAVHLTSKNSQYWLELRKLHEKYGDFIRTGPREICILRKSAIPAVLAPSSHCRRTTWYSQAAVNGENTQLMFVRDPADHRRRRRAWEQGFSVRALVTYQPRIKAKVDLFIDQLRNNVGKPMDVTRWMMMLAFDIMGDVAYGKDLGSIPNNSEHLIARVIHDHMSIIMTLGMTPWLLYTFQYIPGAANGFKPFLKWCASMIQEKKARWDPEKYPQDLSSWLVKAMMEKDATAPPTEAALNDDARLLIIAGSDTSASVTACILHYLAKHPHVLKKLQSKLDEAMPGGAQAWDYQKVLSVTYLDDIIRESLRLKPPAPTGGYRVTPPEGLTIDEVYIPGDINVFTPLELIHTDARYWVQPHEFIPERWGERKKEMGTDETVYIPFSSGAYRCVGDKLAMMSMRTSISSIAQQFDISFAPGETGESFEKDRKDVFTTLLPPLNLCFTPRKE